MKLDTMEDVNAIKPGLYRLTRDVVNSFIDRRRRPEGWWAPMWPAGTMFVIRKYDRQYSPLPEISLMDYRADAMCIHPHTSDATDQRLLAILYSLEPVEPANVHDLIRLHRYDHYEQEALQWLVDVGKLTLNDVNQALKAAYERADDVA